MHWEGDALHFGHNCPYMVWDNYITEITIFYSTLSPKSSLPSDFHTAEKKKKKTREKHSFLFRSMSTS